MRTDGRTEWDGLPVDVHVVQCVKTHNSLNTLEGDFANTCHLCIIRNSILEVGVNKVSVHMTYELLTEKWWSWWKINTAKQEENSMFLTHVTSNTFYSFSTFCSVSHLIPSSTILPCQTIFNQSSIWRLVYCSHRQKNFRYLQMFTGG
jgi:hypothetical protein